MTRLVTAQNRGDFEELCGREPIFGPQLFTDLTVFGPDDNTTASFWLSTAPDGAPSGALCRRGGRLTIAALPTCDPEELSAFARHAGGFSEIYAPAPFVAALSLGGKRMYTAPAMTYSGPPRRKPGQDIDPSPPLLEVYDLLHKADPTSTSGRKHARDAWYTYTSHLIRHNLGCMVALEAGGSLVSTGGVCAQNRNTCTLGNIATLPDHRGLGYGERIVSYLVDWCLDMNKRPTLLCREDGLARFYSRCGFAATGRWAKLELGGLL